MAKSLEFCLILETIDEGSKNNYWTEFSNLYREGQWEVVSFYGVKAKAKLVHDTKPTVFIKISYDFLFFKIINGIKQFVA